MSKLAVEIPGVDFTELARQTIAVHLTEALIGNDEAIRKIVVAALAHKVNERGVVGQSYENRTPFVEWLAQDLIRSATLDVLRTKVEQLRPAIEAAVETELKHSTTEIAKVLTESFIRLAGSQYAIKLDLKANFEERR